MFSQNAGINKIFGWDMSLPPPPHQGVRGLMHDDPQSNLAAIIIITDLYQCKFKNTIPEDYILFYLNLYLQVPEHLDQIILKKQI